MKRIFSIILVCLMLIFSFSSCEQKICDDGEHSWVDGACEKCNLICDHKGSKNDEKCSDCGETLNGDSKESEDLSDGENSSGHEHDEESATSGVQVEEITEETVPISERETREYTAPYSNTSEIATHYATMEIEGYGKVKLALLGNVAPITVENFVSLASKGFYNGLTFHRIMEGFMAQGGDPDGNGTGGNEDADGNKITIKGEFFVNGVENPISHRRGVISMARNGYSYDSASSQFFIVHDDSDFLDGQYAAFGYVVEGMEFIDFICEDSEPIDDNGTISASAQPKIKSVTVEKNVGATTARLVRSYSAPYDNAENVTHYATMDIKDYGKVKLALLGNVAPITVENFVNLASKGFYNGLTFHRIMEGFMAQGGDPDGNGTGGNEDADGNEITIKGEFSVNGIENPISHRRGVISMARNGYSYDSASSQFFIVHDDSDFLDGQYAAFGYVVEGMEFIDFICEDAEPIDSNGTIVTDRQPIITSVTVEAVK